MTTRGRLLLVIVTTLAGSAAIASITLMAPPAPEALPMPEPPVDFVEIPPYRTPSEAVLVRMFRGRPRPSSSEVEVTTVFPDSGFSVVPAVGDVYPRGAEGHEESGDVDALTAHLRGIFSLDEVRILVVSRVPLDGGSAVVHEGSVTTGIRLEGQAVGLTAVRLVVSQTRGGEEVMATSILARRGKTVVLAGASEHGDGGLILVSLTPL